MSLTSAEIVIVNQSLDRIGSTKITVSNQSTVEAESANRHYEQTRDSLLRTFDWRFAKTSLKLSSDFTESEAYTTDQYAWDLGLLYKCILAFSGSTTHPASDGTHWSVVAAATYTPQFKYDYQYDLPADYLKEFENWEEETAYPEILWDIQGSKFLTDETDVNFIYISKITDTTKFDPLFTELLIIEIALRLISAIAGTNTTQIKEDLKYERQELVRSVNQMTSKELEDTGRSDWNLSRFEQGTRL